MPFSALIMQAFVYVFLLFGPGNEGKNYEMAVSAGSPCWPLLSFQESVGTWGVNGR